ncbi:MAG: S8 family serine peptidase [Cytophagales bacterium]|nr:S8 family serine peptidase [Cytophagales bacterium]
MKKKTNLLIISLLLIFLTIPQFLQAQSITRVAKSTRQLLAKAIASGNQTVTLCLAAREGQVHDLAARIESAGGLVRSLHPKVDYIKAYVPTIQVQNVLTDPSLLTYMINTSYRNSVESLGNNISYENGIQYNGEHEVTSQSNDTTCWPPQRPVYPFDIAYHPWEDLDALTFLEKNPNYDGRGVVIAQIEYFVDVTLPELKWAINLQGNRVPKIIDQVNCSDPYDMNLYTPADSLSGAQRFAVMRKPLDWRWVNMKEEVVSNSGKLVYRGNTIQLPGKGKYRIGWWDADKLGFRPKIGVLWEKGFIVVWNQKSGAVWLDTDQDYDLSDEKLLEEFHVNQKYGILGKDDPKTAIIEEIPFGIQLDKEQEFLSVNVFRGSHATMVAGSAVGSKEFGGEINGVAPGAQLITYSSLISLDAYLSALIQAFEDPRVDVVLIEAASMVSGGLHELCDNGSVIDIIQDRLIKHYQKPALITGWNATGINQIVDHAVSTRILTVGAYQSSECLQINNGIVSAPKDDLHWVGSYGPGSNGVLKPDFLSPSGVVSLAPQFRNDTRYPRSLYRLPIGYGLGGGTSQATPVATGAVALLISAMKQENINWNLEALYEAMRMSARNIPSLSVHQQGHGLIQVAKAFDYLKQLHQTQKIDIEVKAPVRTITSHLLKEPHSGVGLYEYQGWNQNDIGTRKIVLVRKNGIDGDLQYTIKWWGNNSQTFSAPEKISIPLNKPVEIELSISPQKPGVHAAILELLPMGLGEKGYAKRIPVTIVVPKDISSNGFQTRQNFSLRRPNGRDSRYISIPHGTQAISMEGKGILEEGQYIVMRGPLKKYGTGKVLAKTTNIYHQLFNVTMPGVWELMALDLSDSRKVDFKHLGETLPNSNLPVHIKLIGATLEGNSKTIKAKNRNAEIFAKLQGDDNGFLTVFHDKIHQSSLRKHLVQVDSGSTQVLVRLNDVSPGEFNDLDVYVFDPEGHNVNIGLRGNSNTFSGESYSSDEQVIVLKPKAGEWTIVVDGYNLPNPSKYNLEVVQTHPKYGGTITTEHYTKRKTNETWETSYYSWKTEAISRREGIPVALVKLMVKENQEEQIIDYLTIPLKR